MRVIRFRCNRLRICRCYSPLGHRREMDEMERLVWRQGRAAARSSASGKGCAGAGRGIDSVAESGVVDTRSSRSSQVPGRGALILNRMDYLAAKGAFWAGDMVHFPRSVVCQRGYLRISCRRVGCYPGVETCGFVKESRQSRILPCMCKTPLKKCAP